MSIYDVLKENLNLLKLDEDTYLEQIGDFFTALTTDGRFIFIDSKAWDLKENHVVKVVVDEGEDDIPDEVDEDDTLDEPLEAENDT